MFWQSRLAAGGGASRGEMAADDELFVLKNFFHLGCYQQAISESISAHPSNPESAIKAKFFMYRAYIEQGQYLSLIHI